jgi:hypothetical protein
MSPEGKYYLFLIVLGLLVFGSITVGLYVTRGDTRSPDLTPAPADEA